MAPYMELVYSKGLTFPKLQQGAKMDINAFHPLSGTQMHAKNPGASLFKINTLEKKWQN